MNEEMWKNASVLARLVSISAQASEMAGMTIKVCSCLYGNWQSPMNEMNNHHTHIFYFRM
jgi:hypothetical protein